MSDHPDFAWWPTEPPRNAYVAGGLIQYSEVKELHDEAAALPPPPANATVTVLANVSIPTRAGTWASKYASVTVEPGYRKLEVSMTGTGAAELYVRKGRNPTVSSHDCRSTAPGTAVQRCTLTIEGDGTYFIRVRTKTPNTVVTVEATKTT